MESDGFKYLNLNGDKSYTGSNKRLQKSAWNVACLLFGEKMSYSALNGDVELSIIFIWEFIPTKKMGFFPFCKSFNILHYTIKITLRFFPGNTSWKSAYYNLVYLSKRKINLLKLFFVIFFNWNTLTGNDQSRIA